MSTATSGQLQDENRSLHERVETSTANLHLTSGLLEAKEAENRLLKEALMEAERGKKELMDANKQLADANRSLVDENVKQATALREAEDKHTMSLPLPATLSPRFEHRSFGPARSSLPLYRQCRIFLFVCFGFSLYALICLIINRHVACGGWGLPW